MRTTLVLKDSLMRSIYAMAGEEHRPIKDVMNDVIERGLNRARDAAQPWTCPSHDLGGPGFDYTKAWELVDGLEAAAASEKLELRK